jgi:hypothetical protein
MEDANARLTAFSRRVKLAAAAAVAAAAAAGVAMVRSGLQTVDAQAKLAQSLGTTVASIQTLERAGELAGARVGYRTPPRTGRRAYSPAHSPARAAYCPPLPFHHCRMQLSALFSPDAAHLVCAGSSGRVHVWAIEHALRPAANGDDEQHTPARISFAAHSNAIYSLQFVHANGRHFLVTGGDTHIKGWAWNAVLEAAARGQAPPLAFRLEHPRDAGLRGSIGALAEANDLAFDAHTCTLFTAAGDGKAYAWDLRTSKLARTFAGHEGYLHCIASRAHAGQIVTGSEDGTARLWDVKSESSHATLHPPGGACGWCSCAQIDVTDDWLVCGWGAGVLTTWSLTAQTCTAAMPLGAPPQQLRFAAHSPSAVYSVGAEPVVYEWTLSGTLVQRITSAATSLFGVDSTLAGREGGLIAACGNTDCVELFDGSLGMTLCELDASE